MKVAITTLLVGLLPLVLSAPTKRDQANDDTTSISSSTDSTTSTKHSAAHASFPTASTSSHSATSKAECDSACFPMGGATLPSSGTPSMALDEWWCPTSQQYGFLGFSYPLEDADCNAQSNSYESISKDMAAMKKNYNASILRVYSPNCRDESIWKNLLRAAKDNEMAIIPMIWWGFDDDQDEWKTAQTALLSVLNSDEWKDLAPYLIHSIAFGSEPIGDGVDGGNFLSDYQDFRSKLSDFGIPVAISEDWDRDVLTDYDDSDSPTSLTSYGQSIASASDMMQLHIMPYYHPEKFQDAFSDWFSYFRTMIEFIQNNFDQGQVMITETPWASAVSGDHDRASGNTDGEDLSNYQHYYQTLNNQCPYFKEQGVGWFWHTYSADFEPEFGLLDGDGKAKFKFVPNRC